jgi:hypothetical protein
VPSLDRVHLEWHVPGAKLQGCASLATNLRERASNGGLFTGNVWLLDGSPDAAISTLTAPVTTGCLITISIQRNYASFLVREILTLACVCQAALLSLRLNPLISPLSIACNGLQPTLDYNPRFDACLVPALL